MKREQLLTELLALLAPLKTPFVPEGGTKEITLAAVEMMPDKLNLDRFQHPRAAVWVGYHSGRFDRADATSAMIQNGRVRFDLAVVTRKLNGPAGALVMLDAIEELLAGARLPSGGSSLEIESDEYASNSNGIWTHGMVVACTFPRVSPDRVVPSDPIEYARLRYSRFVDESFGDTEIGSPATEDEE